MEHSVRRVALSVLLEQLPAAAYTCDRDGLITYFNPQAAELWGRAPKLNDPADRFCGSFRMYHADGALMPHDDCWMARALRHGREYHGHEIVIERPDGERFTALAHANPIIDDSGATIGAVNLLVDISDRKRGEIALQDANRFKDEFLATLSHELRNPLAPLHHSLELLRIAKPGSPDATFAIEVAERQLHQLTRIIDDLLDVSRVAHNKLQLRRRRVQVADVVRSSVDTVRPLLDQNRQQFTQSLPVVPITLEADPVRLAQAISNLLNNAAKYTDPGGRISLRVEKGDTHAVITVSDSGIGIPPGMLSRIFEMFTQLGRPAEKTSGGLGIGLALARRIVELHDGTLTAASPGLHQGSEFTIRLPLAPACTGVSAPQSLTEFDAPSKLSLKVLVVDDNRDVTETLGMLLEMTGSAVRCAFDGEEALELAETFRPDVVLLDIGLPKLSGWAVAERLRREPWAKDVVLIAISGRGAPSDVQKSKDVGFSRHLVKPVAAASVLELLTSLQETKARARAGFAPQP